MADGLKRDGIVILRIDGEDLLEFLKGPSFETELVSVFSEIELSNNGSYSDHIIRALEKLTVDQGMPPAYDSWVRSNIIDVALRSCASTYLQEPVSKETVFIHFKNVLELIAKLLKEQPVIVAHSEKTFNGSGIKRLLSNKYELDKTLNCALQIVPRDSVGKMSNEYLLAALDVIAPSAGLPLFGAVLEMDEVTNEAIKIVNADEAKIMEEEEVKKMLIKILESIMVQLQGTQITTITNSVVHEPLAPSSDMVTEQVDEDSYTL